MTKPLTLSTFDSLRLDAVLDQETLRQAYGLPSDAAVRKQMTELTDQTRRLTGSRRWSWSPARTPSRSRCRAVDDPLLGMAAPGLGGQP
ncbi:hypothetical protein ACFU98_16350 [Streptomyces sp. NPDC057575]|uniref:hypothetical protein n=1 Tax=unclassified Streptomyces TaxID=2593676 RepID=UPI0036C3C5E0